MYKVLVRPKFTTTSAVWVRGNLRNGMWQGLRNSIILWNVIYADDSKILAKRAGFKNGVGQSQNEFAQWHVA